MAAPTDRRWFDPRFTLPNIIQLLVLAGAIFGGWYKLEYGAKEASDAAKRAGERVDELKVTIENRIEAIERAERMRVRGAEAARDKLGDIQGTVATLNERSAAQQRQLDRIERTLDAVARDRRPGPP